MALTLAQIRQRLKEKEEALSTPKFVGDGALYQHWNIEEGSEVRVRFLPDANQDNPYFWFEKQMIKLEFPSVVGTGKSSDKPVSVQVPCIEMWPEFKNKCPILAEVRPWYQDESLKDLASKYWKKRSFIYQGFVRVNPMKEENSPENPIRRFTLNRQLHDIISAALIDPEMESLPIDYHNGVDFVIRKTKKGTYADYGTSSFSRKETALTEDELAAIEKYGLFNFDDFIPKKPTDEVLEIMLDMFHASVDGEAYDFDKWGNYFKPYGFESESTSTAQPSRKQEQDAPSVATTDTHSTKVTHESNEDETRASSVAEKASSGSSASSSRANDLINKIRNRNVAQS